MRCPASSSVTSIQRTAGGVEGPALPSVGIRVYYIWLISNQSTRRRSTPGATREAAERPPKQANVARLRDQAAMVNESTRSTHHEFTPLPAFNARRRQTKNTRNRPFRSPPQ